MFCIDYIFIIIFFSFLYLQSAIKLAGKNNFKKLNSILSIADEKPKIDTGQQNNNNRHNNNSNSGTEHHIKNHFKPNHYNTHNSILTTSALNQVCNNDQKYNIALTIDFASSSFFFLSLFFFLQITMRSVMTLIILNKLFSLLFFFIFCTY